MGPSKGQDSGRTLCTRALRGGVWPIAWSSRWRDGGGRPLASYPDLLPRGDSGALIERAGPLLPVVTDIDG